MNYKKKKYTCNIHLLEEKNNDNNLSEFRIGSKPKLPPLNKRNDKYSVTRQNCEKLFKLFHI